MKKSTTVLVGVIALVIIAAGSYAIFHKPAKVITTKRSTVAAVNNAVLKTMTSATFGQYLTDASGKTLYTYSADTSGVSNCTGTCLVTWPAYGDAGSTTSLPTGVSTIKRTDNGQIQYTYNDMPLYYFDSDSKGQVTGNDVGGFHVAVPVASAATSAASPTDTTSTSNNSSSSSW